MTSQLEPISSNLVRELPVVNELNQVVGPGTVNFDSLRPKVEYGSRSNFGPGSLYSLVLMKDVGSSGPFLASPGKRKVVELDRKVNPPKKPKGGHTSIGHSFKAQARAKGGKLKTETKKVAPVRVKKVMEVETKLDQFSNSLSIQMAKVAGLIMPPPPP